MSSLYQKFIDSASPVEPDRNRAEAKKQQQQQQQQQPQAKITMMLKHETPLPVVNSTMSSTPISKQQYRRLMEANNQRTVIKRQQYCSSGCQHQQAQRASKPMELLFKTDDPTLLKWLQAMRFETELECLTSLQARTLAIDEHSAGALSIRNSQVGIQEMRAESNFILDYIDYMIERLPILNPSSLAKFSVEFSELWTRLMSQTAARSSSSDQQQQVNSNTLSSSKQNTLTIINCTPRKSQAAIKTLRPLDKLAAQIRNLCIDYANSLYDYQDQPTLWIDSGQLESALRKLKELYGRFVEISIRAECANIVRALNYDFSQASLNRLSSSSSLHPARPFESSSSQLPLKWALIALWQLTKDDSYLCRTLTERWQTVDPTATSHRASQVAGPAKSPARPAAAKRLDYSTKYDNPSSQSNSSSSECDNQQQHSLRSDYQKLYQICQNNEKFHHHHQRSQQQQQYHSNCNSNNQRDSPRAENDENRAAGALSSALNNKQPLRQVSTIELLIDIIISQPNKHERLDMMNFIHSQAQHNRLIDLDEWDQSVSAAVYTSNQYKVAALRILNHLCLNEQAVKTILKCFSTPPPSQGQPIPENKIIRSIFECYQTSQEHIYQNEIMFHATGYAAGGQRGRKRTRQAQQLEDAEEFSDYGSRQTNSCQTSCSLGRPGSANDESDEGDDAVVKEAIRLLVQLTTSFHRSNQGLDFYTLIGRFSIDSLVKYLTNIIKSTTSREMLFLSLTALANISFITTEPMKLYGTNRIMLEMFRASKSRSKDLELRDQAVTILANTADKNLLDIVSNGGLTFLLSCLESCPSRMANYKQSANDRQRAEADPFGFVDEQESQQRLNIENKPRERRPIAFKDDFPDVLDCACDQQTSHHRLQSSMRLDLSPRSAANMHQQTPNICLSRLTVADLAAMERIHQKTAVAFARMSSDPSTTRMVLKYGGIKQLIDLCKFSHKRNHSDTVLIACIAALRKMAKVIESETFRHYNALDLIELELNQTLEIYGGLRDRHQPPTNGQRLFASDV